MQFIPYSAIYGTLNKGKNSSLQDTYFFDNNRYGDAAAKFKLVSATGRTVACPSNGSNYLVQDNTGKYLDLIIDKPETIGDIYPGFPAFIPVSAIPTSPTYWVITKVTGNFYDITLNKSGKKINLTLELKDLSGFVCNCGGTCVSPSKYCESEYNNCAACLKCGDNNGSCNVASCEAGKECKAQSGKYVCVTSDTPGPGPPPDTGSNVLIWVIVGIVVLFIIIAGIILFMSLSSKSGPPPVKMDIPYYANPKINSLSDIV